MDEKAEGARTHPPYSLGFFGTWGSSDGLRNLHVSLTGTYEM